MEQYIVLHADIAAVKENSGLQEALKGHSLFSGTKHSNQAVELMEFYLHASEFLLVCLLQPVVCQLINEQKITVKFGGTEQTGNWKKVFKDLCKYPHIKEEFVKALKEGAVNWSGNTAGITKIKNEVNLLLQELETEKAADDT